MRAHVCVSVGSGNENTHAIYIPSGIFLYRESSMGNVNKPSLDSTSWQCDSSITDGDLEKCTDKINVN